MLEKIGLRILTGAAAFVAFAAAALAQGGMASKPLFPDSNQPLFADPLFSDHSAGAESDITVTATADTAVQSAETGTHVRNQIRDEQIDQAMRSQMTAVANWLERYNIRNGSRFPGFTDDKGYAAQVQLTELVPNNPYSYGYTQAMGQHGIAYQYNPNGSPATGSVVWGDQYTEHLQSQQDNRVQLSIDFGINPLQINEWVKRPPQEWVAAPGTITAIGNNQGLFIVWGAGRNGKPIKSLYNGGTYIICGNSSGNVNDQIAPNEN